jgi:uncharacterized protein
VASLKTKTVYSDICRDFVFDTRGQIKMSINADAIRDSVLNIVCTMKGERMFLPEFGSGVMGMLFSPITPNLADVAGKQLKQDIEKWESRVVVDKVNFKVDAGNKMVGIQVICHIPGSNQIFDATQDFGGSR